MTDTKTITHELLDNAGGKLSLDGDQIKVAAGLIAGTLTTRLRTTVVMEYDKVITVAQGIEQTNLSPATRYVATDGDSRPAAGKGESISATNNAQRVTVSGYQFWAQCYSGNAFTYGDGHNNYALGGDDSQEALTGTSPISQVLASEASLVILTVDVNDGTLTVDQTKANNLNYADQIVASGRKLIVFDELPWTSVTGGESSVGADNHIARHDWLRGGAIATGGSRDGNVLVMPTFESALKPGTRLSYKDGYADVDGLHPYSWGWRQIARDVIGPFLRDRVNWPGARPAPLPVTGETGKNANWGMAGTTGTKGSGITNAASNGGLATSWAATLFPTAGWTAEVSKGVDADGYAQQIIDLHGTPTGTNPTLTLQVPLTGLEPGKRYRAVAHIIFDDPPTSARIYSAGGVQVAVNGTASGGATLNFERSSGFQNISRGHISEGYDFEIMSPDIVIPAGYTVTSAFLRIIIAGNVNETVEGARIRVSRAICREVV